MMLYTDIIWSAETEEAMSRTLELSAELGRIDYLIEDIKRYVSIEKRYDMLNRAVSLRARTLALFEESYQEESRLVKLDNEKYWREMYKD